MVTDEIGSAHNLDDPQLSTVTRVVWYMQLPDSIAAMMTQVLTVAKMSVPFVKRIYSYLPNQNRYVSRRIDHSRLGSTD